MVFFKTNKQKVKNGVFSRSSRQNHWPTGTDTPVAVHGLGYQITRIPLASTFGSGVLGSLQQLLGLAIDHLQCDINGCQIRSEVNIQQRFLQFGAGRIAF